jgi:uncharacterized damage-inducible protein DinB
MTNFDSQITETWLINHRINLMLLDALTPEALGFSTSTRGGGSVGHQLAHLCNVRYWKLEKMDKTLVSGWPAIKAEDEKTLAVLEEYHTVSAEAIAKTLQNGLANDGKIKGFSRGIVPFLGYFLTHEAHHRGNILLTLKNCSFPLPDSLKYGIWEWNKI